jgi:ABC-type antimicrobial peptide transport system permease subunit
MKESTKDSLGVTLGICFVIGLLLFLTETRSTGEALQRFNLKLIWSAISIVGITLWVGSIIALIVLYFPDLKKILKTKKG